VAEGFISKPFSLISFEKQRLSIDAEGLKGF